MPHWASLKRNSWITFHRDPVSWQPSLPPTYWWCWALSGICDCQILHEAPASCSVQEFQKPLQTRFPALTITANRICPLSLAPGSEQPCVKLVSFLEITGEENTPIRWDVVYRLPVQYFSGTRAQQSNGWKQGQNTGKNRRIFIQTGSDALHIRSAETAGNGQLEVILHFS